MESKPKKYVTRAEMIEGITRSNDYLVGEFDQILKGKKMNYGKCAKILKKGPIPTPKLRKRIWEEVLNCDEVSDIKREFSYSAALKEEGDNQTIINIVQDVRRTYPKVQYFRGEKSPGQTKLFRLLKAYSIFDPDLGYCQGMSHLAGFLLIHIKDEEEAFWNFLSVMKNPRYSYENIFTNGLIKLKCNFRIIEKFLEVECPDLDRYFKKVNFQSELYCCSFFCTLFTIYFKFDVTTYLWDLFMFHSWLFVARFVMGLMKNLEPDLVDAPFVNMQSIIHEYCGNVKVSDVSSIFSQIEYAQKDLDEIEREEREKILSEELRVRSRNSKETSRFTKKKISDFFSKIIYVEEKFDAKELLEKEEVEHKIDDFFISSLDENEKELQNLARSPSQFEKLKEKQKKKEEQSNDGVESTVIESEEDLLLESKAKEGELSVERLSLYLADAQEELSGENKEEEEDETFEFDGFDDI